MDRSGNETCTPYFEFQNDSLVSEIVLVYNITVGYYEPVVAAIAIVQSTLIITTFSAPTSFGLFSVATRVYFSVAAAGDITHLIVFPLISHWLGDGLRFVTGGSAYLYVVMINDVACILCRFLGFVSDAISNYMRMFQMLAVHWGRHSIDGTSRIRQNVYKHPWRIVVCTVAACSVLNLVCMWYAVVQDASLGCACNIEQQGLVVGVIFWVVVVGTNNTVPLMVVLVYSCRIFKQIRNSLTGDTRRAGLRMTLMLCATYFALHTVCLVPIGVTVLLYTFIYNAQEASVTAAVAVHLECLFTSFGVTVRFLTFLPFFTNARFRGAMKDATSWPLRKVMQITKRQKQCATTFVADKPECVLRHVYCISTGRVLQLTHQKSRPPEFNLVSSETDILPTIPSRSVHEPVRIPPTRAAVYTIAGAVHFLLIVRRSLEVAIRQFWPWKNWCNLLKHNSFASG